MREIQPPARIEGDHPWAAEFVRTLAREDLSPLTVRGYARVSPPCRAHIIPTGTYSFDPEMPGIDIAYNTLP